MGAAKKAWSWAWNNVDVSRLRVDLKVLVRQLERERVRLEREERAARERAARAHESGKSDVFRFYATEAVRFRRLAISVDRSRLQMLKVLALVSRTQTTARTSVAMQEVARTLEVLEKEVDSKRTLQNADEIARRLEGLEITSELSASALDSGVAEVSPEEVAAMMREIASEQTHDTPARGGLLTEAEALEADIRSLERQLGL